MGIEVNRKQSNDELSRRIDADLRRKATQSSKDEDDKTPDLVEDSEYVKQFKKKRKTSKFSWVLLVLAVLAVIVVVLNIAIPY